MSRSRRKQTALQLGHDSFLDIVANLVGILIILVVVLGSQSTAVIEQIHQQVDEDPNTPALATDDQLAELAQRSMRAAAAQADSDRFEDLIKASDATIKARLQERAMLTDLINETKQTWQEKKKELDQQSVLLARQHAELEESKSKLADLVQETERLKDEPEKIVQLEHLPTPMAKTVFGDEIHFRLKDHRLSLVPVDQLISEIRRDFSRIAPTAREGRMDAAVGPIRGYVAHYQMEKQRGMVSRGGQVQMATRIQLVNMSVEPLQEPYGEPLDAVLQGGKMLDIELAGRDPARTTITVWVYPESFADFRALKEHLYRRGYATAARPLPNGHAIRGGPQGTRSNAQ